MQQLPGDGSAATGYAVCCLGAFTAGTFNDTADNPSPSAFSLNRLFQIGNGTFGNLQNALTVLRNGNMGIGTTNPQAKLHVFNGSSGYIGGYFPGALVEGPGNTYFNLATPAFSESGLLFGNSLDLASGGIVYNNVNTPQDSNSEQRKCHPHGN
jgi:hypothetical protein